MKNRDLLALLAEIDRRELPRIVLLGVGKALLAGVSPAHARAFRRFDAWARREAGRGGAADAWRLCALGLAEPRKVLPAAVREAERAMIRLRRALGAARLPLLRRLRRACRNPVLCELLIAESREVRATSLAEAHTWLDMAQEVHFALRGARLPAEILAVCGLRLRAHRANTFRMGGDLARAASLFAELGSDPRRWHLARLEVHAELLSLEASLRTDRREFDTAHGLLARAVRLYGLVGNPVARARTLLKRGTAFHYEGDPAAAIHAFEQAAITFESTTERHLLLIAQHNLADSLVDLGRPADAAALVAANESLYAEHDDPVSCLRRAWLDARIARAQGRFTDAELRLAETRRACLDLGMGYDAALVSLDLAELLLATGRTAEVKALALRLKPIFASQGVHREATAALILFQKAAAAERLTAGLLVRLRRYLLLARNDPTFRFEQRPEAEGAEGGPEPAARSRRRPRA